MTTTADTELTPNQRRDLAGNEIARQRLEARKAMLKGQPVPAATRRKLPIVRYTRPRCPFCGSLELAANGTRHLDGDVLERNSTCQTCGQNLVVICE